MTRSPSSSWIEINPSEYDEETIAQQAGVEFHVFISPYDMPQAVRGGYDANRKLFAIDFKYIGDEPTERQQLDQYVTMHLGKKTRRLYRIDADVHGLGVTAVGLRLTQAIDQLRAQFGAANSREANLRVAKEVLVGKQKEILRALTPA